MALATPWFGRQVSGTVREYTSAISSTRHVAICYGSPRKLTLIHGISPQNDTKPRSWTSLLSS